MIDPVKAWIVGGWVSIVAAIAFYLLTGEPKPDLTIIALICFVGAEAARPK